MDVQTAFDLVELLLIASIQWKLGEPDQVADDTRIIRTTTALRGDVDSALLSLRERRGEIRRAKEVPHRR
jgi:hypothetical protein